MNARYLGIALVIIAAALAAFGADYKFETPVYRRGEVVEGHLHGDLILVAKGDLGHPDLPHQSALRPQSARTAVSIACTLG